MGRFTVAHVATMFLGVAFGAHLHAQGPEAALARPTPAQYVWHEQERIMFVCLDPCTWQGREYDDHSTPLEEMVLPRLDTDQWCEAARSWGAREILFVAKHTGGFCWWRTDTTEYGVRNIAWKGGEGDLLVDLAKSCAAHGLSMGIYVYPGDETWGAGIGSGGKTRDPAKQEAYNGVFRRQLREAITLAAEHTRVLEVWFDGSCVIEVGDVLAECAPDAVVFQGPHASIRWVGNEGGRLARDASWSTLAPADLATGLATAHHSKVGGGAWAPLEVDTTLYDHFWFWAPAKEAKRKGLDELMRFYYASAGQGAVMLLNSTPNTAGLLPVEDVRLYRELGEEIERRFAVPLAETAGRGARILELDFPAPTLVNHTVLEEDILHGERIRHYWIEGRVGGEWVTLAMGEAVGRKRIDYFVACEVDRLRVQILQAAAPPLVRKFAAYQVADFRPPADVPEPRSWSHGGEWAAEEFVDGRVELDIDLSPHLTEVGQWAVSFVPAAWSGGLELVDAVLLQQGQASAPGALTRVAGQPLTFRVNRTAVVTERIDVHLRVTLQGKPVAGIVVLQCENM